MEYAFVTGATGLLGNNLVHALLKRNIKVKALVRSVEKAKKQFGNLPVEFVEGDMLNVDAFSHALQGCDALFHTAAYFRDSYKGGKHWQKLYDTNVTGTERLLQAAYAAGIRRAVHTSSIAVLKGNKDQVIDETMSRSESDADDYYLSKILSEQKIQEFLLQHPDMFIAMVLPGWMFGPGDIGPTSSGQFLLDFVGMKLPGVLPGSFSVVDARDVAEHQLAAITRGRSGERYLAAGNHMNMKSIFQALSSVSGVKAPERKIPLFMLRIIALIYEGYYRVTKKPVLISTSTVKLIEQEQGRTHFSHNKSLKELECKFRPVAETLTDTLDWYRKNNYINA
ncbi:MULTISPECIES: SDR family oxidoreductase [unclassified Pseudomonas]|uniref:SDR family oxidoreductase n=1 Tax=unclassified Pseudomonas TaxID=196821 RepID=UPI0019141E57|nr:MULTISPECIES: SDR family oxidoreductase [unclassified Pseudomonas]MBK5552890.1 SDR family oxidoreductase [Pseudomonas sp. TH03]MEB0224604.1 SDR family oxidoreductase [Pseudomonas sp. 5S1]MEB0295174.1 SDR family oxidoreductase [Pseudomonas sp. 10S4]WPX16971.1 SDR family oxidoreductase [Pseudomonas sp. 10S4]